MTLCDFNTTDCLLKPLSFIHMLRLLMMMMIMMMLMIMMIMKMMILIFCFKRLNLFYIIRYIIQCFQTEIMFSHTAQFIVFVSIRYMVYGNIFVLFSWTIGTININSNSSNNNNNNNYYYYYDYYGNDDYDDNNLPTDADQILFTNLPPLRIEFVIIH